MIPDWPRQKARSCLKNNQSKKGWRCDSSRRTLTSKHKALHSNSSTPSTPKWKAYTWPTGKWKNAQNHYSSWEHKSKPHSTGYIQWKSNQYVKETSAFPCSYHVCGSLCTVVKKWTQPLSPSIEEWIKKMWLHLA
jgi:hypothetical protein